MRRYDNESGAPAVKVCADCLHGPTRSDLDRAHDIQSNSVKCKHQKAPLRTEIDVVTGVRVAAPPRSCRVMRMATMPCGPNAMLFEAREQS